MLLVPSLKQFAKRALPQSVLSLLRDYRYKQRRPSGYRLYQEALKGKVGLEVGGPSIFFRHVVPVYGVIAELDGVNFAETTMWEGTITTGRHFEYAFGRVGFQHIAEATRLAGIESGRYQFLISSNCLEHVADPLKALNEWIRVVEPQGMLLLVLPNPTSNFDHRRPVTSFEHLLDDYEKGIGEDDLTHLPEILELHDLVRDPWAGTRESFVQRCHENQKYRGMHHHVFDLPLIERMLSHCGMSVLRADVIQTDFIVLARTPGSSRAMGQPGEAIEKTD